MVADRWNERREGITEVERLCTDGVRGEGVGLEEDWRN